MHHKLQNKQRVLKKKIRQKQQAMFIRVHGKLVEKYLQI